MIKDEMIKIIEKLSGKYSSYQVFSDFVEMSSLAISNSCSLIHNKLWQDRESQYIAIVNKYNQSELELLQTMFDVLARALEENIEDVLGYVYMKAGCGSKQIGQFFTPYHLSKLCAEVALSNYTDDGIMEINEPSVGGGGMIIGTAATLHDRGINYQKKMRVVAQDLDWKGVYMSYIQFSLLGIDAVVVQGDTLSTPYIEGQYPAHRVFRTPKHMGVLL